MIPGLSKRHIVKKNLNDNQLLTRADNSQQFASLRTTFALSLLRLIFAIPPYKDIIINTTNNYFHARKKHDQRHSQR